MRKYKKVASYVLTMFISRHACESNGITTKE